MYRKFTYFLTLDFDDIVEIHDNVIEETGGLDGFNDSLLKGVLARVEHNISYNEINDPIEIASWYGYAVARGHAFVDGNKRTALSCMDTYLDLVNININLQPIPEELANLMERVAEGCITQQELANWLRSNEAES